MERSRFAGPRRFLAATLLPLLGVLACGWSQPETDFALIYNPAARHHGPDRNPIIAIPGVLGTRLVHRPSEVIAWGAFDGGAADPAEPTGARLISLPIDGASDLADLRDDVETDGVLERVRIRLAGVPIEVSAYAGILATLGAGGYRDEALGLAGEVDYGDDHFTCFQFPYDWRRDNVENARRLHEFILEKRAYVREQYRRRYGVDRPDVRFDIVAHSMGGLLTRYFLMYGSQEPPEDGTLPELTWEGAAYVERAILVATPSGGSVRALLELVRGRKTGPLLPFYPAALLGTFPSIYQLVPRARHGFAVWDGDAARPLEDVLDPALWERLGWGLASPEQADVLATLLPELHDPETRRRAALALQRRILSRARAFALALDRPAPTPEGLELFLVAGDAHPTPSRVSVDSRDGSLRVIAEAPGDGTVLRSSALLDERAGGAWQPRLSSPIDFHSVLLLPDDHLGLTQNRVFRDNVLFWLLEEPR